MMTWWLMTRTLCRLAVQIGGLFLIFRAGQWGASGLHIPLPGNVLGMLLLFGLLSVGLVRETWIQEGATLLTKHLAFFFIPIAVGLMEWGPLFQREGHWLLLALAVSTLAALLTAGGVAHLLNPYLLRSRGGPRWATSRSLPSPSRSPSASMR